MTVCLNRRSAVASLVAAFAATSFPFKPTPSAHSAAGQPGEHIIEITSFKFVPEKLAVKPGDTITRINRDIAPHTATAANRSWDTGKIKKDGKMSMIVTPDMAKSYFCKFHPVMKAGIEIASGG